MCLKVNSKMISKMDMEKKNGLIIAVFPDTMLKELRKVLESRDGLMVPISKEILRTIKFVEKESTSGQMDDHMRETGRIIK